VQIADTAEDFVAAAEYLISPEFDKQAWLKEVDKSLLYNSWDRTWGRMMKLLNEVLSSRYADSLANEIGLLTTKEASSKPAAISHVAGD
jgi:hypothetical protein